MISLREKAYNIIREKIINCKLMPGDVIDEKELIAQTGCSRTPVREALNSLAQEGFVRIVPRRGIFVSDISIKDIHDIYELKQELEPIIVRMHGSEIPEDKLLIFQKKFSTDTDFYNYTLQDAAFHMLIVDCCTNKYYRLIMNIVSDQSQRIMMLTNEEPSRLEQSRNEHLDIINALLEKDVDRAADAVKRHYRNSLENIMKFNTISEFLKR